MMAVMPVAVMRRVQSSTDFCVVPAVLGAAFACKTMEVELKKYIERYLEEGWSPFPVDITAEVERTGKIKKTPHFPKEWKSFQTVRLHESQIEATWKGFS